MPSNLSVPATGAACVAGNVWPPVVPTAAAAAAAAGGSGSSLVTAASGATDTPNGLAQNGDLHSMAGGSVKPLVCLARSEKDEALAVLSANLVLLNTSDVASVVGDGG